MTLEERAAEILEANGGGSVHMISSKCDCCRGFLTEKLVMANFIADQSKTLKEAEERIAVLENQNRSITRGADYYEGVYKEAVTRESGLIKRINDAVETLQGKE